MPQMKYQQIVQKYFGGGEATPIPLYLEYTIYNLTQSWNKDGNNKSQCARLKLISLKLPSWLLLSDFFLFGSITQFLRDFVPKDDWDHYQFAKSWRILVLIFSFFELFDIWLESLAHLRRTCFKPSRYVGAWLNLLKQQF